MKKGVLYGIGAYLLWDIFHVYWKLLESVPAIQVIAQRIIWSFQSYGHRCDYRERVSL
jgi:chloramphenicol-sensitive protein RarD